MAAPTNLHRDLGRIEGKLDAVIADMRRENRRAHDRLDDHDGRIKALETLEENRRGAIKAARWLWGAGTIAVGWVSGMIGGGYIR